MYFVLKSCLTTFCHAIHRQRKHCITFTGWKKQLFFTESRISTLMTPGSGTESQIKILSFLCLILTLKVCYPKINRWSSLENSKLVKRLPASCWKLIPLHNIGENVRKMGENKYFYRKHEFSKIRILTILICFFPWAPLMFFMCSGFL